MKYLYSICISLFISLFLVTNPCFATSNKLASLATATDVVQDLATTITDVKKKTNVAVVFPRVVPLPVVDIKYYASSDLSAVGNGIAYIINIDSTKDCNGAHYCNIGSLRAEQGGNPQIFYDRDNKPITINVMLANNIKGYYTPGHAMGDYFSP